MSRRWDLFGAWRIATPPSSGRTVPARRPTRTTAGGGPGGGRSYTKTKSSTLVWNDPRRQPSGKRVVSARHE